MSFRMQVLKMAKEDTELITQLREVIHFKQVVDPKKFKEQRTTAKEIKVASTRPDLKGVKKIEKKQKKKK